MPIRPQWRAISLVVLAALLVPAGAAGQQQPAPSPQEFAAQAAIGNRFEIEAARLALKKGVNKQVKTFAEEMLRDHGKAGAALQKAASDQGITLPDALDKPHADKLKALEESVGGQFDPAYTSSQVSAHEEAVALFERYAKDGEKGALRNFAERTFPTLRMHLIRIQSVTGP